MTQKLSGQNYPLRALVGFLVLLAGFIFPLLFIVGGVILWSLFQDVRSPTELEDHPLYDPRKTPSTDPTWREKWFSLCESPAESAFLTAMIEELGLSPLGGILSNGTIRLNHQVEIRPYRADFVVNELLVVEIDGAAYHSSPEAIDRDVERDRRMKELGYTILRIPAKLVFHNPSKAVGRVQLALAGMLSPPEPQKEPLLRRVSGAIDTFNASVARANKFASEYKAPSPPTPLNPEQEQLACERAARRMQEFEASQAAHYDITGVLRANKRVWLLDEEREKVRKEIATTVSAMQRVRPSDL